VSLALADDLPASSLKSFLAAGTLPGGVNSLSFLDERSGWALVQESSCQGVKQAGFASIQTDLQPFTCRIHTRLLSTEDGGLNWHEISP
jgi:hypothetical protein